MIDFYVFFFQAKLTHEIDELKSSSEISLERLDAQSDEIDKVTKTFNERIETLQQSLQSAQNDLDKWVMNRILLPISQKDCKGNTFFTNFLFSK